MKRTLATLAPVALLAACQPYGPNPGGHHSQSGGGSYHAVSTEYGYSDCAAPCASGQGYSVAPQQHAQAAGPLAPDASAYGTHAPQYNGDLYGGGELYGAAPYAYDGLRGRREYPAFAYGEIGGVFYDTEEATFGVQGRLGYQFNRFVGVEAEGSVGVTDMEETFFNVDGDESDMEYGIDYQAAGFGVARLPIGDSINILWRLGYHKTEVSATQTTNGMTFEGDGNFDGLAYGNGVEFAVSPRNMIRLGYTRYEGGDANLDTGSVTFQRKF